MKAVTLITLCAVAATQAISAFPMYGGKRYSRTWAPIPLPIYPARDTRPYAPYYDPYGKEYAELVDLYYPQDPYDNYRVYQMPYYYPEMYPYYYGYDETPENTDEGEWMPDEKEDVSYGQEAWYDGGARQYDSNAEANAYFLQNLILAQMYKDAAAKGMRYPVTYAYPKTALEDYDDGYVYGEPVREVASPSMKEDEDVRELKSLMEDKPKMQHRLERTKNSQKQSGAKTLSFPNNQWMPSSDKRTEKKVLTTAAPTTTTMKPFERGQEEVVMLRPATPVRTPSFQYHSRSHEPSVYDAIKKLLHMQEELDKSDGQPKKRSLVPSEDSLVEQLGSLKKSA